jgi:hypothetical protein
MHYRGIVDSRDAEWYDAVLDECSSLDVNDFLHIAASQGCAFYICSTRAIC